MLPVRWARLLLAVVLLGGCSGGRGDDTLLPPASSSTTADYSVPTVIDAAYVEKVMEALDHVYGDAIRILARERQITKEFLEHLAAIYTPNQFEFTQRIWVRDVASGLKGLRRNPGDPATQVQELLRADATCIVVRVNRDFSQTNEQVDQVTPQEYVALVPAPSTSSLNPTPLILSFDGFVATPEGAPPEQPCGG